MGIKFFCNKCGVEIFQGISQEMKETETVAMVEIQCVCLGCILNCIQIEDDIIKNTEG